MRFFHVFEDLEQDNFLFIREGEWKSLYERLHEFTIERSRCCMVFTFGESFVFLFDSLELKAEKLRISEFMLCSFKCFDGTRKMDIIHRVTLRTDSFFLENRVGDVVLDFWQKIF